jgi:taurine dioxygenase
VRIEPVSPAIGAVVCDVDLCVPLDDTVLATLEGALVAHHVLFFENQPLTPRQHRDFAARFGALHVHPVYPHDDEVEEIIVLDTNADNPPDSDTWHSDVSFIPEPPMGAMLAARVLPPRGGDTLFASCIAAYEALSAPMRAMLDGLTAEHDIAKAFTDDRYGVSEEARERLASSRRANPPVIHPVVRTHPISGRRGIFVNRSFTTRIMELAPAESEAVLGVLFDHVSRPEFVVRWSWKVHDLAFWDNRLTQHYACADYMPHRRVMHRATILGDRPR